LHCSRRAKNRLALDTEGKSFTLPSEHLNLINFEESFSYHSSSDFTVASYPYLESDAFNIRYAIQSKFSLLNLYIGTSLESEIDLRRFNAQCYFGLVL